MTKSKLFPFTENNSNISDNKLKNYTFKQTEGDVFAPHKDLVTFNKSDILWRYLILFVIINLILALLFFKIYFLQIIKGSYYQSLADGNRIRTKEITSQRGFFYDRRGVKLVNNVPRFSLNIIPADLPDSSEEKDKLKKSILAIFPDGKLELDKVFQSSEKEMRFLYQKQVISNDLDREIAMKILLSAEHWPGVEITTLNARQYLYPLETAHILGYTGKISLENYNLWKNKGYNYYPYDTVGVSGLEKKVEFELRGQSGRRRVEVNALGKVKKILTEKEPTNGLDFRLSLDLNLQQEIFKILQAELPILNVKKASIVILNSQTGAVLSLISWPSFDNNIFTTKANSKQLNNLFNDPDRPLFNRVVSGQYPSGSTFKPVIAAAALYHEVIKPQDIINSSGGIWIKEWFFPDWLAGGHGQVNLYSALANSVNTYFYVIGGGYQQKPGLGANNIISYATNFGLGNKTGIDLPGEKKGLLPSPSWKKESKNERWYLGDTYNLSIGQGDLLVTPLQVAVWTNVFANQNRGLVKPFLINQLSEPNKEIEPIISPFIWSEVRQGLQQTVLLGSARSLQSLPITSAGKTGSAQISGTDKLDGWFAGFAPFNNPEITIVVLLEESEGSNQAVAIAKKILSWYFSN